MRLAPLRGKNVSVCSDFNDVRTSEERRSVSVSGGTYDVRPFNKFIEDNLLCDLHLCGRKFTWFKGDGRSMSKIDRFLLTEEWCLTWPNWLQVAQLRGLSDHCALCLSVDEENWGPKPSRFLKCWSDTQGIRILFVTNGRRFR